MAKKRMTAVQKARARLERETTQRSRAGEAHVRPPRPDTPPPPEAVEAYAEVLAWAAENPALAGKRSKRVSPKGEDY